MCAVCDPIFDAADVGFVTQVMRDDGPGAVTVLLWEANPVEFAEHYPDSGIVASYGDQWPAPCIDYWVYLDARTQEAHLNVEGWSMNDEVLPLTGDGTRDGLTIGASMARILRVQPPRT